MAEMSDLRDGQEDRAGLCRHYLTTKRRFCKFPVHGPEPSTFCVFHGDIQSRIPCPYDPGHTVLERDVERHLRICSARPAKQLPSWHVENWNLSLPTHETTNSDKHVLETCSLDEIHECITIAKKVTAQLEMVEDVKTHQVMSDRVAASMKLKHSQQQSSLLGHMHQHGMLDDDVDLYIEWGAGKAELSRYVARATSISRTRRGDTYNNNFLLIDRESPRLKHDNRIREDWVEAHGPDAVIDVSRLKIDIAHLQLDLLLDDKFPKLTNPSICSVSKHLCGAATDLTLASLTSSRAIHKNKSGILIALCCHHICSWQALTSTTRDFLIEAECRTPRHFDVLRHMTSWHTSGLRCGMSAEVAGTHRTGLSHAERDRIGWMCKRTIDLARVAALKADGWSAQLIKYQSESITTECVALLATRERPAS